MHIAGDFELENMISFRISIVNKKHVSSQRPEGTPGPLRRFLLANLLQVSKGFRTLAGVGDTGIMIFDLFLLPEYFMNLKHEPINLQVLRERLSRAR